jgi:hypothetical protein
MLKVKATEADGPKKKPSGLNSTTPTHNKPKPAKKISPKPLPAVLWTKVPTQLSYDEVTQRMFIREFFLRFGGIMDPPFAKSHSDELDFIVSRGPKSTSDDGVQGWVSEMCLRALMISLLGFFARTYPDGISKVSMSLKCPIFFKLTIISAL